MGFLVQNGSKKWSRTRSRTGSRTLTNSETETGEESGVGEVLYCPVLPWYHPAQVHLLPHRVHHRHTTDTTVSSMPAPPCTVPGGDTLGSRGFLGLGEREE